MDYFTGSASKIMAHVPFPASFTYPCSAGTTDSTTAATYGLYAVVVHSGVTLNGGHYYTFGRSSAARDLHAADSDTAPWRKFDDRDVTATTFAELSNFLSKSGAASAYMLFYRRLTAVDRDGAGSGPRFWTSSVPAVTPEHAAAVQTLNESLVAELECLTSGSYLDEMHSSIMRNLVRCVRPSACLRVLA
jgi:hypothetical protein